MRKTARTWIAAWMVLAAVTLQAQPAWPTKDWETATPEAEGVDSHALAGLVTFGTANQMDSLLVARHGRIVLESYWGPFEPGRLHTINSATKSVLSALVGIAIEQGALPAADTPVLALMPGRKAANVDPRKQALQLQHLLDMTSGLDWIEPLADAVPETALQMYRSRDWTQFVLDRPMAHAPGEVFNYSSGNSQLLCAILGQAVGMRAEAFAAKNLLQPLGITQWRWRQDPGGNSTGGFGLYLQPRDMAKFGLLYLRHGQWEGRQLVPRAWVERTFQAGVPMNLGSGTDFRYGNGWWALPARKAFMAVGFHRQLIVLLPDADVVAVTTARSHFSFDLFLDQLQAAVRAQQPLPPDPAAAQALAAQVRAVAVEPVPDAPAAPPPLAQAISGRSWKAGRNTLGIQEFTLRFGAQPEIEIVNQAAAGGRALTLTYGLGAPGRPVRTAGSRGTALTQARWTGAATLAIQTRYLEEGETASYVLRFDGDRVAVDYAYSTGLRASFSAEAR